MGEPLIPTDNPLTKEGVWLGKLLFYDSLLSSNGKQSCGSCHLQEHAFTDGKKLAVGSYGDTIDRNTMSLVNLAWNKSFFWDGRIATLEQLVRDPVTNPKELDRDTHQLVNDLKKHKYYPELFQRAFPGEEISMNNVSKSIAQFLRTIISTGIVLPDSVYPKAKDDSGYNDAEYMKEKSVRGSFFRFANMCSGCHGGFSYGGHDMADNHIEKGTSFKAPSMINVMLTAPYMHDGRFNTIEEVLKHYDSHISKLHLNNSELLEVPVKNLITDYDKKNLVKLLELFTDSSFISNPQYSNPFGNENFSWLMN